MKNIQFKLGSGIAIAALLISLPISRPATSQSLLAQNTTVEDIVEDPLPLLGETLTVRGAVDNTNDNMSFVIKDEDLLGLIDDAEVLVINRTGAMIPSRPQDDIELQATGTVERLTPEMMMELGLDAAEYSQYENRAVVLAESIALSVSPDEIFDNPEAYYYKPIAVKGEVEQLMGGNAFTIEDDELTDEVLGSEDLLVIGADSNPTLEADSGVVVTGVIRPLDVAEVERYYGISLDSEYLEEVESKYTERPVLLTTGVYPIQ